MRILHIYKETYADGPGIRYAIYVSGCDLKCFKCQNPESWNFNQGQELTLSLLSKMRIEIRSNPLLTGITISGGDPLHKNNANGLLLLLKNLEEFNKHIMVFTGHLAEQLISHPENNAQKECLSYIDILIDGQYMHELRETTTFRGSSNQRFIRIKNMVQNNDLKEEKIKDYIVPYL